MGEGVVVDGERLLGMRDFEFEFLAGLAVVDRN
jgi:hypothetical protein